MEWPEFLASILPPRKFVRSVKFLSTSLAVSARDPIFRSEESLLVLKTYVTVVKKGPGGMEIAASIKPKFGAI